MDIHVHFIVIWRGRNFGTCLKSKIAMRVQKRVERWIAAMDSMGAQ
jgi:hypothetical protein